MLRFLLIILSLSAAVFAQNANVAVSNSGEKLPEPANTTLQAFVYFEDTGRPVKRTSVMLMSSSGPGRETAGLTDGNGKLVIKGLKPGKYYPMINAPGVVSPMAYLDLSGNGRPDNLDEVLAGFPAIIVDGVSDLNLQIPAKRGGAISGRVLYENGDPAIGVKVDILRKVGDKLMPSIPNMSAISAVMFGGAGTFQTDDRGVYRFAGLPAGEYAVRVTENVAHTRRRGADYDYGFETLLAGSSSMLSVFFENAFEHEKARPLNVQFGQELSEINIVLPDRSLHVIEGKVVAAKDKLPIRGARVSIKRAGGTDAVGIFDLPGRARVNETTTDENGAWQFVDLPKGTYTVSVTAGNSEFDEKAQAYGMTEEMGAGYAANLAANAMNTAAAYGNANRIRPGKPPGPKFAAKTSELTLEAEDLTAQTIELNFGAAIIGDVTLTAAGDSPGPVTITAALDSDTSGRSSAAAAVYFYGHDDDGPPRALKKEFRLDAIPQGLANIAITVASDDYYVKSAASNQIDLLKGAQSFKEGDLFANVHIVLAKDTGILKGSVVDSDKQPVPFAQLTFIPVDSTKMRSSTYYRHVRADEKGEFEVKLPPFEYAFVPFAPGIEKKPSAQFYEWLAEAVKRAPTFRIEAGQTSKASLKIEKAKR